MNAAVVSRTPDDGHADVLEKLQAWLTTLTAAEAGMLWAVHPGLIPTSYGVVAQDGEGARGATAVHGPRFAATLQVFARVQARLDEFRASLTEEEQQAFALMLLAGVDTPSLLRHLLAAS